MRSGQPTRKLLTETQLYMSAQRALMRRAHSIPEMKKHLERRAENKDLVPAVIARLRELNYLDDAKYALNYAAQHAKLRGRAASASPANSAPAAFPTVTSSPPWTPSSP